MVPRGIKRAMGGMAAMIAGSAGLVAFIALARRYGWLGPGFARSELTEYSPTLLIAPFVGASMWYSAAVRRVRLKWKEAPHGLCGRCDYPLPAPGAEGQDGPVTCPECGVTRTRAAHRTDWTQWFGMQS